MKKTPKLKTLSSYLPKSESELRDDNVHSVPKKQWKKWGVIARQTFNGLFAEMMLGQRFFTHPNSLPLADADWKTIAWNTSWIAASTAENAVRQATWTTSETTNTGGTIHSNFHLVWKPAKKRTRSVTR